MLPADRQKMMKGNDGNILDLEGTLYMSNDILNYTIMKI